MCQQLNIFCMTHVHYTFWSLGNSFSPCLIIIHNEVNGSGFEYAQRMNEDTLIEQIRSCQILRCHVYSNAYRRSKIWILRIVITWIRTKISNRHLCEEIKQQSIFGLLCVYISIPHILVYHLFGQHHKTTSGKKFRNGFTFQNYLVWARS